MQFCMHWKVLPTDLDVLQMRDIKITGIICGSVRCWDGEPGSPDQEINITFLNITFLDPSVSSHSAHFLQGENLLY